MTAIDVADRHPQQNIAAAVGQIGQPPVGAGQAFQLPLDTLGRLSEPEQFGNIIIKAASPSAIMTTVSPASGPTAHRQGRRRCLRRRSPPASCGSTMWPPWRWAQNYNQSCTFDGNPAVGLGVYQLPGTNALDVADRVRAKMEELKHRFPDGVDYNIGYDTTPFIRESIGEVYQHPARRRPPGRASSSCSFSRTGGR